MSGFFLDVPPAFRLLLARRANVAQLAEQLTRNEQASGSNPLIGSTKKMPEGPVTPARIIGPFFLKKGRCREVWQIPFLTVSSTDGAMV